MSLNSDAAAFLAAEESKGKAQLGSAISALEAFLLSTNTDLQSELPVIESDAVALALDAIPQPARALVSPFINGLVPGAEAAINAGVDKALNTVVATAISRLKAAAAA